MKNSNEYITLAKKTESQEPAEIMQIRFTQEKVFNMLSILQDVKRAAEVVEQQKKNLFYNREVSSNVFGRTDTKEHTFPCPSEELIRLTHAVLGMVGEMAEIIEILEKAWTTKSWDRVNMVEELGDVNWYQAILCDVLQTNFEHVWDVNIKKLKARYGDRFTEVRANTRDLRKERTLLENETQVINHVRLAHDCGKSLAYILVDHSGEFTIAWQDLLADEAPLVAITKVASREDAVIFCNKYNLIPVQPPKDWEI